MSRYTFIPALVLFLSFNQHCNSGEPTPDLADQANRLDATLWKKEIQAQEYEKTFIHLWDVLRKTSDKSKVLKEFPFTSLQLGKPGTPEQIKWGIQRLKSEGGEKKTLTQPQWSDLLDSLKADGYRLLECEFHHAKFDIDPQGFAHSTMNMLLHVVRTAQQERHIIKGALQIDWSKEKDKNGNFIPDKIDATDITVISRKGLTPFIDGKVWTAADLRVGLRHMSTPEPLILYDLDRDGLSEIILPGWNLIFWNVGNGRFETQPLLQRPISKVTGAILADFDNDGQPDLICAPEDSELIMVKGLPGGRFSQESRNLGIKVNMAVALTAGDLDKDGVLDLFVSQYRWPVAGQMAATPYYDANDGHPSYLLKNDGHGNFTDITEQAGLSKKRNRRTFSTSLVDLNDDSFPDLLVVSDFCGVDLYHNDGRGRFIDVTSKALTSTKLFGMGHSIADFNCDGKFDFYAIGMSSTTARRLEAMKLNREDLPEHNAMRMKMGYGNRMYLGNGDGTFADAPFDGSVNRTGWSWGVTAFDFENDGFQDIFVANGFKSGQSCKDYCTEFWRHDIYMDTSKPNPSINTFLNRNPELYGPNISWNGFEHKNLLMNLNGKDFINVAFLMGVAYEFDGRAVVSDDLNADGKVDLLVTEWSYEINAALHMALNNFDSGNNWIGVRLREEGGGFTPVNAQITVASASGKQKALLVTGDSYRAQHANTKHFGLSKDAQAEYIEVKWANGKTRRINKPAINQYHYIAPEK
ncbi:MAG TPA: CRTAC1 family protein [Planctomycetota bacterium]|nr:CRTAC1 family protein [Planctomycetota bacterium]